MGPSSDAVFDYDGEPDKYGIQKIKKIKCKWCGKKMTPVANIDENGELV